MTAIPTTAPATALGLVSGIVDGFDQAFPANVVLVTGKGGVGKTTVAATIALAAVATGRRTLVIEVETGHSLSKSFDTAPWDYAEREVRPGMWGAALDPAAAVYEYLELFYGLRRMHWLMERSNALDFVTTAAPGLRDLLLIGKVYEIESRRSTHGRRVYDTIVVDAPPTGRIVPFLQSPEAVTDIVRMGAIRRQAGQISRMISDPRRTQAVLVTLCEEMPVAETLAATKALRGAGMTVGPLVANQVDDELVTRAQARQLGRMSRSRIREVAGAAGLDLDTAAVDSLRLTAGDHRERLDLQSDMLARLEDCEGSGLLTLPRLGSRPFHPTCLAELAHRLSLQLVDRHQGGPA